MIFVNAKINRINESNKFRYYFTNDHNLKNSSKNIALVNLSIYYTWKNIKSVYSNSRFKISAPMRNDEFNLSDGLYSTFDIQDCFE